MSLNNKTKNVNSRCIFVGNIPYDSSEKELIQIFEKVGRVVSFRLVTDRDTGKPKGYGFCEYEDKQIAHCAIRNLNNTEFYGRSLRVDHATAETNNVNEGKVDSEDIKSSYCQNPPPVEKPTLSEETVNVVKALTYDEKIEILANMKVMTDQNPKAAEQLLKKNPQLSQAILAILIVFEIITAEEIQKIQEEDLRVQTIEHEKFLKSQMLEAKDSPQQIQPPRNPQNGSNRKTQINDYNLQYSQGNIPNQMNSNMQFQSQNYNQSHYPQNYNYPQSNMMHPNQPYQYSNDRPPVRDNQYSNQGYEHQTHGNPPSSNQNFNKEPANFGYQQNGNNQHFGNNFGNDQDRQTNSRESHNNGVPKRNPGAKRKLPNRSEGIMEKLPEDQKKMLKKLLTLDSAQIAKMPNDIQRKVRALREKMEAGRKQ